MTQFIDTLRDNILFPVVDGNTNKYMSADRLIKSIQYLLLDILKHKHFDENTFRAEIDEILQKSRQAYMVSFDAKATAEDAKSQLLAVIEASNNATEKSEKAYALAQQAIDETAKIPDIKIIAGTWWINCKDTGVSAQGPTGNTPTIEIHNNTWWINGVDTGLPSKGDPGQFDFDSLTDEQKALLKDFINSVIAEYDFSKLTNRLTQDESKINQNTTDIISTQKTLDDFLNGVDSDHTIDKWQELVKFLASIDQDQTLAGLLHNIELEIVNQTFSKDISTELKLNETCTILATEHKCGLYTDVQVYMSDTSLNWEKVITDVTKNATGDITITVKNVDFTNIGKVLVQIHKITAPV